MRKLVFALTAAAAVAFAVPNVSFARDNNSGGGGGSHASGGHSGGGGRSFSGGGRSMGSARSMNVQRGPSMNMQRSNARNFNRHVSNRDVQWNRHMSRNVNSQNFAAANTRSMRRDRVASNNWQNDRHHRHHRHHRNFGFYFDTPDYYYDDYAGYDTCYQYLWTRYGYRYVNTCASDYYAY